MYTCAIAFVLSLELVLGLLGLPPYPNVQIGSGEYQNFMLGRDGTPYAVGGNLNTLGTGNVGVGGTALKLKLTPADLKFKQVAGVLHGGMGVDVDGYVWNWGDGGAGQMGDGNTYSNPVTTPIKILTDISGNPFTNIDSVFAGLGTGVVLFAVKQDGTLWAWGDVTDGFAGDGTDGVRRLRPVQIPVPGVPGTYKVKQITASSVLIVLRDDGTVWTCGGRAGGNRENLGYAATGMQYATLHQLTSLTNIVQVTGGASFSFALKNDGSLYGWGYWGHHLGINCGYCPTGTPTLLTGVMNALPAGRKISQISANAVATHMILDDGSLWGFGDNAQGTIGNGVELNFTATGIYSWDFGQMDLPQYLPVRVVPERSDFVHLSTGTAYVFYKYAVTTTDTIYAWGRNKGGVIGNGVLGCSSNQNAYYPNAWDIALATVIQPFELTAGQIHLYTSPMCAINASLPYCRDNGCVGAPYGPPPAVTSFTAQYTGPAVVGSSSATGGGLGELGTGSDGGSSTLTSGVTIGIAVGGGVFVLLMIILACASCRKARMRTTQERMEKNVNLETRDTIALDGI